MAYETIEEAVVALVERGEAEGGVSLADIAALAQALDLDDEQAARVYERLDEHGVEVRDDAGHESDESVYVNGELAVSTTDALQQFLNEAGRYPLLTAEREVELAKRIERGDKAAKDLMI